ncbi:MAG: sulfatase [Bryobacterales bacterium]|nr:sulfatase [Bryobacterales bacterium]MDE0621841.1 sulfatase [Bryobacterales bacterium]
MRLKTNLSALLAALCMVGCGVPPVETDQRPNFIIVFADDQGYGDLGCFGATDFKTPRIDRMASEGMRFTDFYAQPVCGPSRTALLTGSYPIRVAEYGNEKNIFPYVHEKEILLPKVLQEAGYATGMIGKVDITQRHRGFKPELNPVRRGFDYWFGVVGANDSGEVRWVYRNEERIQESAGVDDLTRRYTDEALAFIRQNKDGPFFLYIAHTMAHVVLGVTEPFQGRSERGLYGDVIEELDASTGEIVDLLTELGLDQNTIVVYTSDNGPWSNHSLPQYTAAITEHAGSSGPLRGAKGTTWEGGIRVPTVMWAPGRIPAGTETAEVASAMDLLPTFIQMAGAELPADRTLDGRDIGPLMRGEPGAESPHEAFYYYRETHLDAVRSGPWKLVFPRPGRDESEWLLSKSGAFLGELLEPVTELALYNLESDIGETSNVAADHPDVVERLTALADAGREELGDHDRIGTGVRFFEDGPKWPRRQQWMKQ